MSRKIRLFSSLKYEQQSEIKDCLTYGVFRVKKVEYKGKMSNAVLYESMEDEFLVILDSIDAEDFEEDFDLDID